MKAGTLHDTTDRGSRFGGPPTRRDVLGWGAGLTGLAALGAGCVGRGRRGGEVAPGLLVVAIDGLRADHLGLYGYDRETSPLLDEMAKGGLVFDQAFSSAPALVPAHVSLLTGCQPWVARRFLPTELDVSFERRWHLPVEVPHFAVELLARGWATAGFVDDSGLSPLYGFRTGFQLFADSEQEEKRGLAGLDRRIQQWVRGVDADRPFFAYVQLHDLERSWAEPDRSWERFFYPPREELSEIPPVGLTDNVLFTVPYSRWRGGVVSLGAYEAAYDGHIRRLDMQLQTLFDGLRSLGRFENTTIVVVGSYGLQFGEAGLYLRAGRYSVADLHVPLIIRPRRGMLPEACLGQRFDGVLSTPDLVPTLLDLEGIEIPWGTHGVSHAAAIRSSAQGGHKTAWAREVAFSSCGIQEGCVLLGPRYCLEYLLPADVSEPELSRSWFGEEITGSTPPQARFYDRILDPHPPLSYAAKAADPVTFEQYRAQAAQWIVTMEQVRRALQGKRALGANVDPATLKRLRDSGYLPRERRG